jgi:kynurenine formamidase
MDVSDLLENLRGAKIVDLSHTFEEHMPALATHSKFFHNLWGSYWHGGRALSYQVVMHEHSGTHVDAPAHFISDAKPAAHITIDNVPLTKLIGRGVRIDCRTCQGGECVSRREIVDWELRNGALAKDDIVLFDFGWAARWKLRPDDQSYAESWPGISVDAADYLISRSVAAIGVDTFSPDPPQALGSSPTHLLLLEKQILIIENLTNLGALPKFFVFLALPLKIGSGSGSPIRPVAVF